MTTSVKPSLLYDVIILGGGAAGIFGAIQVASLDPTSRILVLEKSNKLLSKVKISGGGRCNVTHACFDPMELVDFYPRGQKELIGPFHRFMTGDMMGWLEEHGVQTKIEDDGRVFPVTDSSQTIIDCFLQLCNDYHIEILTQQGVIQAHYKHDHWEVQTKTKNYCAQNILWTTGSSTQCWNLLADLGHQVVEPVPSLFTFNIQDPLITELAGIAFPHVSVEVDNTKLSSLGPLLITHWGLSGPAVLKLSAWGARQLHELDYQFTISVNWVNLEVAAMQSRLEQARRDWGARKVFHSSPLDLPKRFYQRLITLLHLQNLNWADLSNLQLTHLVDALTNYSMTVQGKSTYKAEFVTSGGIDLSEVNFKTMESKVLPRLYFAGEVLNIDGVTGGFNFQAAWTTAFLAAKGIAAKNKKLVNN